MSIRRRRECPSCHSRFTTTETASLTVIKRSGVVEAFSREKIVNGLGKACHGRPVTQDDLELLASKVEEHIRSCGSSQVSTGDIGRAILDPLRELDKVAYLRFASVYSNFNTLEEFEEEIHRLKQENSSAQE